MDTKILIGIPSGETVKAKTARTLVGLAKLPLDTIFCFRHGNFSFENREKLADAAIEQNCTHLFLVDNDMDFEPFVLTSLLEMDKDIAGASYNYRYLPLETTVRLLDANGGAKIGRLPVDPFECYSVPSGCTLIKTEVFKSLAKPYYTWTQDEQGTISATEDVLFCEKARAKGYKVWCHPSLGVKHIGEYAY